MRARYYNQDIKRFINRDVVSGNITNSQSLNRYCYVQGNPVSLIDPFGLCPSEEEIASIKWRNKVSNFFHGALDVGGFFFDGFDLVNAFIYAAEGNNTMAALSLVCMIPGFGTLFGIPAKIVARIGANVGEAFLKAGRQYFPEILEGGSKLFNRTRTQIDNARAWINQKINRLLGKNSDEIVGEAYLKSGSGSQYVSWMNEDTYNRFYANNPSATLGAPNGAVWVMRDTDAAMCTSIGAVARDTGMAGGVKSAYLNGDTYIYGIVVDSNSVKVYKPTSSTPGVNTDWNNNGRTAVNGEGFVLDTGVEEFVIIGGNKMPKGSYSFRMDDYGNIEILEKWN